MLGFATWEPKDGGAFVYPFAFSHYDCLYDKQTQNAGT